MCKLVFATQNLQKLLLKGIVNQLLFVTSLFHSLLDMNWFAATYFHDQDVDYPEKNIRKTFENWFNARKILEEKALMNLSKICLLKVDLH